MPNSDAISTESTEQEMERRMALLTSRFPERFSEAQIGEIRARIERSVTLGRSLRAVELGNGVGPELVVTALPPRAEAE
jgi:hypothetical protein